MALFPVPDPSRGRNPRVRIIVLLVALAAVFAVMVQLHETIFFEARPGAKHRQNYRPPEPENQPPDPLAEVETTERFLGGIVEAAIDTESEEAARKAHNLQADSEAIYFSLAFLKGLSEEELQARRRANRHVSFTRLLESPQRYRGRVMHTYGILMQKDVQSFPDLSGGLQKMWRLTFMDARQTHFYTILTPLLAEGARRNDLMAAEGLFLKAYPFYSQPDPKKGGFWQWTPLFVAQRVYHSREPFPPPELLSDPEAEAQSPPPPVEELDPEVLDSIARADKPGPAEEEEEEGRSLAERLKSVSILGHRAVPVEREVRNLGGELAALTHLFGYVHRLPPAKLEARARRVDFVWLMKGSAPPEAALWQPMTVQGEVLAVETQSYRGAEEGVQRIHLATIHDERYANRQYQWTVATLNLPHPLRRGDRVRARGIFVKFLPYQSRTHEWHWTPMLVSPRLTKLASPATEASPWTYALLGLLVVAAGVGIYLLNQRDDTRRSDLRERVKERRAARDAIRAVKKRREPEDAAATPADATEPETAKEVEESSSPADNKEDTFDADASHSEAPDEDRP